MVVNRKLYFFLFCLIVLPFMAYLSGYNILFSTTDSIAYKEFYEILDVDQSFLLSNFEYGFTILAFIGKKIFHLGYYNWITGVNLLSLSIKFWVFSRHKNYLFISFVYIFFLFPFYECLVVRAAFGHSIVLYALHYFFDRKLMYTFTVLLAFSIHSSMILFLPLILIPTFGKTSVTPFWVIVGIFSLIILKQFIIYFLEFYPRIAPYYYENPKYFNIWGIPRVALLFIGWFCLFKKLASKRDIFWSNQIIVFMIIAIITFEFSLFSIRIIDLILPLFFILLVENLKLFKLKGYYLFIMLIAELFYIRTVDGPGVTLLILKWLD